MNMSQKQTFLSFVLGEEKFAVNIFHVLEVLELKHITALPKLPDYILGVMDFRGQVVTVVSARKKLNVQTQAQEISRQVIVMMDIPIANEPFTLGMVVDAVEDVVEVNEDEIRSVDHLAQLYHLAFLDGMFVQNERFIIMLNMTCIFDHDDLMLIKKATEDQ